MTWKSSFWFLALWTKDVKCSLLLFLMRWVTSFLCVLNISLWTDKPIFIHCLSNCHLMVFAFLLISSMYHWVSGLTVILFSCVLSTIFLRRVLYISMHSSTGLFFPLAIGWVSTGYRLSVNWLSAVCQLAVGRGRTVIWIYGCEAWLDTCTVVASN